MRLFTRLLPAAEAHTSAAVVTLTLSYEQRRRARLRVTLSDGTVVGLQVPRGSVLRDGDRLGCEEPGVIARVRAGAEHVSVVETADPHLLARAAYHLGNRHVPLQIEPSVLAYPHDHVLDGMCRELGLKVSQALRPFEPETGGYGGEHSHGNGSRLAPLSAEAPPPSLRPEPGRG